jgi:hypothetical protein
LIEKGLFDRLPATFSTYFFDQVKEWDLLFPAEHSYFERLSGLLDRSKPEDVDALFAPMRAVEARMGVNEKTWPRRRFTLDQVDFLNRSPYYAEWRKAVAGVFARLDPILDAEVARNGRARLVVVLSPPELPAGPDRMWTRLRGEGRLVKLEGEFDTAKHLGPLLAAGEAKPYDRWAIESGAALPPAGGVVRLSYEALQGYRARLMKEVRDMVQGEQIRGPRELGAKLKKMKVLASEGALGRDPVLAEFARAVLLSGNGTLLINNTFVEWATVQAVRRARPSMVAASFGVRNKVKPFSSLLIYTDQETATPIPTQMDTLGTYVDLEVFYQYVWQEFEKYPEYRRNTVYLFLGLGMDAFFTIAPQDFTLPGAVSPERLAGAAREWMRL